MPPFAIRKRFGEFGMARYQTDHGPTVSGGMIAGFVTVLGATVAAFMAAHAGAFDRGPVARMDVLQARESAPPQIRQSPVARLDVFEPQQSAGAETGAPTPDAIATSAMAENESGPSCDVDACSQAFRSFRSSDCTFQPYDGPRKLCAM